MELDWTDLAGAAESDKTIDLTLRSQQLLRKM